MRPALILTVAVTLAACREEQAPPAAFVMTDGAIGHYCQMFIADHPGPKAQVFLEGFRQPVWFSEVSAAAAFRGDREREAPISVVYVSDMARAISWERPGDDNWIAADVAFFVIDSQRSGGMGQAEAVPFGTEEAAAGFAAAHGGAVVTWDDVPNDLATAAMDEHGHADPTTHGGDTK